MTDESHSTSQSDAQRRATLFQRFSHDMADKMGSYWAFLAACLAVLVWGVLGPLFHFAERWELAMNTGATVLTFLMVFLVQAMQKRDAKATHLKLDELIRATESRNHIVNIEEATEEEIEILSREFQKLRAEAKAENPKASAR